MSLEEAKNKRKNIMDFLEKEIESLNQIAIIGLKNELDKANMIIWNHYNKT